MSTARISVRAVCLVRSAGWYGKQEQPIYTLRPFDRLQQYALTQGPLGQDLFKRPKIP